MGGGERAIMRWEEGQKEEGGEGKGRRISVQQIVTNIRATIA